MRIKEVNSCILGKIRTGSFLEMLVSGIPEYFRSFLTLNFCVPGSIIGPIGIHLLIPRSNDKTIDTGIHSNGEEGKSKNIKHRFPYLSIINSQDKGHWGNQKQLYLIP